MNVVSFFFVDPNLVCSELQRQSAEWERRSERTSTMRFINRDYDESDLRRYIRNIQLALDRFQVRTWIHFHHLLPCLHA